MQASDLHLDSPFAGLPPGFGRMRRAEQMETLGRLVETVRDAGADALLLAGDVFERATTRPETVREVARLLGTLAPTPVVVAPGNHDPVESAGFWTVPFPENVTVFGAAWGAVRIGPLEVWGRGFTDPLRDRDPLADFPGSGAPFVMVLHADAAGAGGSYAPVTPEGLRRTGALWTALGHIHRPLTVTESAAYAGSLEPLALDEEGAHGALLVTVEPSSGEVSSQFLPLARRQAVTLDADQTGLDRNGVQRAFGALIQGLDPDRTLLRIRLRGTRDAHAAPAADMWHEAAAEAGWFAHIVDATAPFDDAEPDPGTVRGRFVQAMRDAIEGAGPDEAPLLRRALADGIAALEGRKILDL